MHITESNINIMTYKTPIPQVLTRWAKTHGFDCANINSRIQNGITPLMYAAKHGELEVIRVLLTSGADVNLVNNDKNNAIWFGCFSNEVMIVRELLLYGCNIDNQNDRGATPLIYCASTGKFYLVRELVDAGADLSKQTLNGNTALDSANTRPILNYLKLLDFETAC